MAVFLLLIVGIVAIAIMFTRLKKKRRQQQDMLFDSIPSMVPGFKASKYYKNSAGLGMIVLDENLRKIVLSSAAGNTSSKIIYNIINFDDLIDVEMLFDGKRVNTNEASSTVSGQVFGGGRATVRTNLSVSAYNQFPRSIELKLLLNKLDTPSFDIVFHQKSTTGFFTKNAQIECRAWMDTFMIIIRRRQSPETLATTSPTPYSPGF